MDKGKSISDVEIFSVGTWNGDEYTAEDLDAMVSAFDENNETLKPYLKLGHDKDQKLVQSDGYPAAGWITKLKRVGEKLVADFSNVPTKIFDLINKGAYRKVSSEIYWNIEINGKKYDKFLSGVALLGSDMPAVGNLNDIIALYSLKKYSDNESTVKSYDYQQGSPDMEKEIEELKKQLSEKIAEIEDMKKKMNAKDEEPEEIKNLKKEFAQAKDELEKIKAEKEAVELDAYIATLKDVTPAMKPYVKALLGKENEKKSYSVGEKELSKNQILEEILKLHSAADVNLDESSSEGESGKTKEQELAAKIDAYVNEHKVTYAQAYKAILKGE